jgi:hypothetical protein
MNITESAHSLGRISKINSSILITPFSIYLNSISKIGGPHGARSAFSENRFTAHAAFEKLVWPVIGEFPISAICGGCGRIRFFHLK